MERVNPVSNPPVRPEMSPSPPITFPTFKKIALIGSLILFIIILSSIAAYLVIKSQSRSRILINSPLPSAQSSLSPLSTQSSPQVSVESNNSLPTNILTYTFHNDWQTYSDSIAGFSFQYPPRHKFAEIPIEGKSVYVLNCFDSPQQKDLCTSAFTIDIYKDYNGGSRRQWLNEKFSVYKPYYMNWVIDRVSALVAIEGNPGGSSGLFIAIPKNKTMILFTASFVAWDPNTGKLPDLSYYNQILSTLKFLD